MAKTVIQLPTRKITVELNIKVPNSSTFPTAKDRENQEEKLRKMLRRDIPG